MASYSIIGKPNNKKRRIIISGQCLNSNPDGWFLAIQKIEIMDDKGEIFTPQNAVGKNKVLIPMGDRILASPQAADMFEVGYNVFWFGSDDFNLFDRESKKEIPWCDDVGK